MLLVYAAMDRTRENLSAVLLSLKLYLLQPLLHYATTAVIPFTPDPATSLRKGSVLPPEGLRRRIDQKPAVHKIGWFGTATRIFQRVEGRAVLLVHTAMGLSLIHI